MSKFHYICGAGLAELATCDVELMEEEPGPSKKRLRKSTRLAKKEEMRQ
jgi:hypothetical protein